MVRLDDIPGARARESVARRCFSLVDRLDDVPGDRTIESEARRFFDVLGLVFDSTGFLRLRSLLDSDLDSPLRLHSDWPLLEVDLRSPLPFGALEAAEVVELLYALSSSWVEVR